MKLLIITHSVMLLSALTLSFTIQSTLALSMGSETSPLEAHAKVPYARTRAKLDLNALRNQGKSLYKNRDYRGAELLFIKLVQHKSTNAKDYTFLARSAMRAQDFPVAAVAYLIYFELTRRPKAKLRAEYKEVSRNLDRGMAKRKLKAYHNRLEEALHLIKADDLSGEKGALATIDALHRAKIFHPLMNRAHLRFKTQLLKNHDQLIQQLLNGERVDVKRHQKLLRLWGARSWGDHEHAQKSLNTLKILTQLKSRPEVVLTEIADLERQGIKLPQGRLRQLQLGALMDLNRAEEAYLMADGLAQGIPNDSKDIQSQKRLQFLHLVRGFYGHKLKPEAQVDAFVEMLSIPSPRARQALKIRPSTAP